MIIGLMGFECNSPNKGCEALGYSFVSILKNVCTRQFELYVFSNDELGEFYSYFSDIKISRIPLKIKDITVKTIRAMSKCDYIFDVTLGDSFSDIYSIGQCIGNMRFKTLAELFCKRYVLLPQTYGPYNDETVQKRAVRIINKAYQVYSRDLVSKKYVQDLQSAIDIYEATDLAFVLPYDSEKYSINNDMINVGINVSGLLWKGGFSGKNQFGMKFDYKEFIEKCILYFAGNQDVRAHIIPHVIDKNNDSYDDDYKVSTCIGEEHNVIVAPAFNNPIEAKSYISKMDFFIGSRMHSTIAAVSSGVPTLPVSYSRKFEGLFNTVGYKHVIRGTAVELQAALNQVKYGFENRDLLLRDIVSAQDIIRKLKDAFIEQLDKTLNNGVI